MSAASPVAGLPRPPAMMRALTPLVGREDEVRAVADLIASPEVRLVTLSGPGGVGKTRVALAALDAAAPRYPDGALAVDLSGIAEPGLVRSALAAAAAVPESADDPEDALLAVLAERRLLLLLDNFEHVIEAAPFVVRLLAACPGVDALVTSRERLRVGGEQVVEVRPLAVAGEPADPPAAELFVQRAIAAGADPAVLHDHATAVRGICARLDGLPLAIELAAAWAATLSPPAMLARLVRGTELLEEGARDAPARQRTMRATIAWTEGLLAPAERDAFRRLAVFPAGFTLDAAAVVLAEPEADALRLVGALVDRHLVYPQAGAGAEPRFAMLETIAAYARERLHEEDGAEALRDRLLGWCAALVERGVEAVGTAEQGAWLRRVDLELDTMRAALAWGCDRCDPRAVQLAGGLWRYWFTRGYLSEGRRWSELALSRCADGNPADRARLQQGIGALAQAQGDDLAADAALRDSLDGFRALGDDRGLATSLNQRGQVALNRADPRRAAALHEEALATARRAADPWRTTHSLNLLAHARLRGGDPAAARAAAAEALAIARPRGDQWGTALALATLGNPAIAGDDPEAAERNLAEALALLRQIGDRRGTAAVLAPLAALAARRDDRARAVALLDEAAAILRAVGDRRTLARLLLEVAAAHDANGDAATARASRAEARALAVDADDAETAQAAERALRGAPPAAAGRPAAGVAPGIGQSVPAAPPADPAVAAVGLTSREVDVLRLLVSGQTNREIGDRLFIGHRTVATHVINILGKLGVESRTAAAAWAVRHGLG